MTKDEEELKVIYSALDDQRRLIAAGKVQRWDVVKWGVTVNVGLATAAAAIPFKGAFNLFGLAVPFSLIPFLLAVLVAFTSWLLVLHYNRRATGARTSAVATRREGHRSPRSGPAVQHRRWGREPC